MPASTGYSQDGQSAHRLHDSLEMVRANLDWLTQRSFLPNEADTRRALIDPVLDGLGWPMRGMGHVFFEHPLNTKDKLDYVLSRIEVPDATEARRSGIVVEAKSAGETLRERDYGQLASYMTQMAVPWGVLTNGRTWVLIDGSKHLELARDRVVWSLDLGDWKAALSATREWRSISFSDDAEQAIDDHDRDLVADGTGGGDDAAWTHYIAPPSRGARAILPPNADGTLARLRESADGTFDILAGSFVMPQLAESLRDTRRRHDLERVLAGRRLGRAQTDPTHANLLMLRKDLRGLSPSAAAAIVLGRVANGHVEGRQHNTTDGRNDKDILIREA